MRDIGHDELLCLVGLVLFIIGVLVASHYLYKWRILVAWGEHPDDPGYEDPEGDRP